MSYILYMCHIFYICYIFYICVIYSIYVIYSIHVIYSIVYTVCYIEVPHKYACPNSVRFILKLATLTLPWIQL